MWISWWTSLIFSLTIYYVNAGDLEVQEIGNGVKASKSGVEIPGVTFLLDDIIFMEGILFAYSAFFRSDSALRFQVWRPMNNVTSPNATRDGRYFRLIGETRVIPSVTYAREDVYIASKLTEKCVRVRAGDRLGVYLEEGPGAVAYTFDPNDPMALGHIVRNLSDPVQVNETVLFDALTFPYDFSLTAYLHTDMTKYSDDMDELFECPQGLWIPSYVKPTLPPTPPPTGKPGATGATGPQGVIGLTGHIGPVGGTGATGPDGITGATGTAGATGQIGVAGPQGGYGATGAQGEIGHTGPRGEKGEDGQMGPPGPAGPPVYVNKEGKIIVSDIKASAEGSDSSTMSLIILAWLLVVTIVVVIVLVLVIMRYHRNRYPTRERLPSAGSDFKPSWMDALKETEEKSYDQSTLRSDGSEPASVKTEEHIPTNEPGDRTSVPGYLFRPNSIHVPTFQYDTLSNNSSSKNTEQTSVSS